MKNYNTTVPARLLEYVERVTITNDDRKLVEAIIARTNGNASAEEKLATKAVKNSPDVRRNIARYKVAMELCNENVASVFLSSGTKFLNESMLKQAIVELKEITGAGIEISGKINSINEQKLNEFFNATAYDKLIGLLDKAAKVTEKLRLSAHMYPEDWAGNEAQVVQEKLKSIFKYFTQGGGPVKKSLSDKISDFAGRDATENPNQKPAYPGINKFAMEAEETDDSKEQLNEWFAMSNYKNLLKILDKCAIEANAIHSMLEPDKAKLKTDAKEVLAKIKKVWKIFNITPAAGKNVSYAGDEVNKLSAKPYMNKNTATPEAEAAPEKKSWGQRIGDKARSIGKNIGDAARSAIGKAGEFAANDAMANKDQTPAYPKVHKFANESKQLKENAGLGSYFDAYRKKGVRPTTKMKKGQCFITYGTGSEFCISNILSEDGQSIIVTKFNDGPNKGEWKDPAADFMRKIGHSFIPIEEMQEELVENLDPMVQQPAVCESIEGEQAQKNEDRMHMDSYMNETEELDEKEKPSAGLSKKKKSNIVKKAENGKNVGKGNFDKVAKNAAKEYGSKEEGEKVAAAAMWNNVKR